MVLGQEVRAGRGDPAAVRAGRRRRPASASACGSSASPSRCRATSRGRRRAASTRSTARTCRRSSTSSSTCATVAPASPRSTERVNRILGHPVNVEDTVRPLRHPQGAQRHRPRARRSAAVRARRARRRRRARRSGARAAVSASAADLPTWRAIGADRPLALRALVIPARRDRGRRRASPPSSSRSRSRRASRSAPHATTTSTSGPTPTGSCSASPWSPCSSRCWPSPRSPAWWRVNASRARDRPPVVRRSHRRTDEPRPGADDRRPARGRTRTRSPRGAGALGAGRSDRRDDRRRRVPDVPRRDPGRGHGADAVRASCGTSCSPPAEALVPPTTQRRRHPGPRRGRGARPRTWQRAVPVNGHPTPMFGTSTVKGDAAARRAARARDRDGPDEIAFAPTTMRAAATCRVGDRVRVGSDDGTTGHGRGRSAAPGDVAHRLRPERLDDRGAGCARRRRSTSDNGEDYLLVTWRRGVDVAAAAGRRVTRIGGDRPVRAAGDAARPRSPTSPASRTSRSRSARFFALLALRHGRARAGHDGAPSTPRPRGAAVDRLHAPPDRGARSRGRRRCSRWRASSSACPLGIAVGRLAWRWLADDFPIVYVPPFALLAVLVVASIAIVIANALAAGPAHAATRIRPAEALRVE